ncbi:MAG: hypothetical protein AAF429_12300 [Pseudomonadota bacterium]
MGILAVNLAIVVVGCLAGFIYIAVVPWLRDDETNQRFLSANYEGILIGMIAMGASSTILVLLLITDIFFQSEAPFSILFTIVTVLTFVLVIIFLFVFVYSIVLEMRDAAFVDDD